MATSWRVTLDASDEEAYTVLQGDRVWNSFAIADLAPPFRAYSQVAVADGEAMAQQAACLVLRHPQLTVLSPWGADEGIEAILASLDLPTRALIQAQQVHMPALRRYYHFRGSLRELLRMAVTADTYRPPPARLGPQVERLTSVDAPALLALYEHYSSAQFRPDQVEHGIFFGVRVDDILVASGGTHVVAPAYGVSVIGNVLTHPAMRRQGYARAIVAALTNDLLARGCRDVVLNVIADNVPAIRLYEGLGFTTHTSFWAGEADLASRELIAGEDMREGGVPW